jgi:hypothetical protein
MLASNLDDHLSSDNEDGGANEVRIDTTFCHRCRKLFEYAMKAASEPYPVVPAIQYRRRDLWPRFEIKASRERLVRANCRLCRFLGALGVSQPEHSTIYTHSVHNLLANISVPGTSINVPIFSVAPNLATFGLLHHNSIYDNLAPRLMDPESVDFGLVKTWLDFCKNSHASTCKDPEKTSVPGFKVIDCRTKQVVHPEPGCRYVALSYVWGRPISSGQSEDSWPLTIQDSIAVTLRLGLVYLWVDRYVRAISVVRMESERMR